MSNWSEKRIRLRYNKGMRAGIYDSKAVAWITGATSGIGEAVARKFASLGIELVVMGRRKDRLASLADELVSRFRVPVTPLAFDVSQWNDCRRAIQENEAILQRTSVLVNNAGIGQGWGRIHEADPSPWGQMIDTNLKGLLYMTRLLVPAMQEREEGHIFNISSVSGRWSFLGSAAYCASKFAVSEFSKALREELKGTPIRVTNIEPGLVGTALPDSWILEGMTPLRAEDIAEAIAWSLEGPGSFSVDNLVIYPTDQTVGMIDRKARD